MIHQDQGSSSSSPLHNFFNMPPPAAAPAMLLNEERGLCLIQLLFNCAAAAAEARLDAASAALEHIDSLAAPDGDAMQRLAVVFAEALARRVLCAWPGLCRALLLPRAAPTPVEVAVARRHFFDLCPFLRMAGAAANQAILEAMVSERYVHVIDLGGADATATQWLELLHLLAARPEGPPHFRLTTVHEHNVLNSSQSTDMALRLAKEAESLDLPFQFNPVATGCLDVEFLRLCVKTGEALAISSSLQLHRLLPNDDHYVHLFLGALRGLSPKVMVVTEQEASHNTPGLTERFVEALNYYAALFDCLEAGAARGSVERARVERWLLGEEIKDIVACDGAERRERHDRTSVSTGGRRGWRAPGSGACNWAPARCCRRGGQRRGLPATASTSEWTRAAFSSAGRTAPSSPSLHGEAAKETCSSLL